MEKLSIENLKKQVDKQFNHYKYVPLEILFSSNILFSKHNGELIMTIKNFFNRYANHSYKKIEAYRLTQTNNELYFEKVGYLHYRTKDEYTKITQIEIENDQDKNTGYGTILLKSFEYFEGKYSNKKVKVIGAFAPKHIKDTEKTKHFYNKNGYAVKKELFSKSTIIKKVLDPRTIPSCKTIDGLNFIENSKENELSL